MLLALLIGVLVFFPFIMNALRIPPAVSFFIFVFLLAVTVKGCQAGVLT